MIRDRPENSIDKFVCLTTKTEDMGQDNFRNTIPQREKEDGVNNEHSAVQ